MNQQIKLGVFSLGKGSQSFLAALSALQMHYQVVGFHEHSSESAALLQLQFGLSRFSEESDLLMECDAVLICGPAHLQANTISASIRNGNHVFIEHPYGLSLQQAKQFSCISNEAGVVVFTAFQSRFNAAFRTLKNGVTCPRMIEINRDLPVVFNSDRVASFNSQLLDDLDFILSIIPSPVRHFKVNSTNGNLSETDAVLIRLEFENGTSGQICLSKFTNERSSSVRIFQYKSLLKWDEQKNEVTTYTLPEENGIIGNSGIFTHHGLESENQRIDETSTHLTSLEAFHAAITGNSLQSSDIQCSLAVFKLYTDICAKLNIKSSVFAHNI